MPLCGTCRSVDFRILLAIILLKCQDRQKALDDGELYDARLRIYEGSKVRHHDDIFEIEKSSKHCAVCKVIFRAFEKSNIKNVEDARGLQIMFYVSLNNIAVCYNTDSKGDLVKLCGLDIYMDGPDVEDIFRFGKIREDHHPPILKRMDESIGSKGTSAIAASWLRNCLKNHPSCRPPVELQKPPKRLISVGTETQNPFLVETFPDLQQVEWLSLSYCWGEQPSKKLCDDTLDKPKNGITLDELKNGIPLADFDPTIQDAISVTRALGIPYIWIDALCIIQGGCEWSEEASRMNEIYGGSIVTLAIASSKSVKEGFLKKRDLNYVPFAHSTKPGEEHRECMFLAPEWIDNVREHNEPWSKRGWTMQEGLLPSRLLKYTASQIVWSCGEEQRFERGITKRVEDRISETLTYSDYHDVMFGSGFLGNFSPFLRFKRFKDYLPASLDYPLMSQSEKFHLWYDLIEDYTQREFTDITDRLVAISGLARIYSGMIWNSSYVVGLWKEDLIRGLLWHIAGTTLIHKRSKNNIPAFHMDFPSWSWVSVGYEAVKNDLKTNDGLRALSEIKDIRIELVDKNDLYGAVKSASITITGPVKKFSSLYNKEWKTPDVPMSKLERHISEIIEEESQGGVEDRYSSPSGGHFLVLQMLTDICVMITGVLHLLVLEATGKIRNGINTYRRVGILQLRFVDPSSYDSSRDSSELIATLKKAETSITARLGLQKRILWEVKNSIGVYMEVKEEKWMKETVIIV